MAFNFKKQVIGAIQAYSVGFDQLDPEIVRLGSFNLRLVDRPISRALITPTIVRHLCIQVQLNARELISLIIERLVEFLKYHKIHPTSHILIALLRTQSNQTDWTCLWCI